MFQVLEPLDNNTKVVLSIKESYSIKEGLNFFTNNGQAGGVII